MGWVGCGVVWCGVVGWGVVKIISSNDIMCHVHSHPPSHHIGKILDRQSFITGKRVLVVHNTHPQQKNMQARSPCSVQETLLSQHCKAQSFRRGFLSQIATIRCDPPAPLGRGTMAADFGYHLLVSSHRSCAAVCENVSLAIRKCCKSPGRPNFDRESRCNK